MLEITCGNCNAKVEYDGDTLPDALRCPECLKWARKTHSEHVDNVPHVGGSGNKKGQVAPPRQSPRKLRLRNKGTGKIELRLPGITVLGEKE
jgi:hypothetical protein